MGVTTRIEELREYTVGLAFEGLGVQDAAVSPDERQDGELVTRVELLVNDPGGEEETWPFEAVRTLKRHIAMKAVELDLPPASVTLVPESDAGEVGTFSAGNAEGN